MVANNINIVSGQAHTSPDGQDTMQIKNKVKTYTILTHTRAESKPGFRFPLSLATFIPATDLFPTDIDQEDLSSYQTKKNGQIYYAPP